MIHVTYTSELWHIYEWFMSHMQLSHGIYTNDSCHVYIWVMAHIWMIRVTYTAELWHIYEWFMSRIHLRYGTYMNDSCHVYIWVMAHIWMMHVTKWFISHTWMSHGVLTCSKTSSPSLPLTMFGATVTGPVCAHDTEACTPLLASRLIYVYAKSFLYVTWLMNRCAKRIRLWAKTCHTFSLRAHKTSLHCYMRHDPLIYVPWSMPVCDMTWCMHVCDMTHSCMLHDPFMCVPWCMHVCDMTHSRMLHDTFLSSPSLVTAPVCTPYTEVCTATCVMTHSCMGHDSFIYATWLMHSCDVTHSYVCNDSIMCVTGLVIALAYERILHSYACHGACMCATWLISMRAIYFIDMRAMTHSCACHIKTKKIHKKIIHVTWLIHKCAMTDAWMWVPWRIYTHATAPSYVCHDAFSYKPSIIEKRLFMCVSWLLNILICVSLLIDILPYCIHMHLRGVWAWALHYQKTALYA